MKIAICVNGESFKFEKGYYWLKQNYLDKYDCDIYTHTWDNSGNLDKILDLYQPKDYYFQSLIPFDDNDLELNIILNKAYSSHACFNLVRESTIEYDFIINLEFGFIPNFSKNQYDQFASMPMPIAKKYFDYFTYILYYNFVDENYKKWESNSTNKSQKFIEYHLTQNDLSLSTLETFPE